MNEFSPDMEVICMNEAGEDRTLTLKELLPFGFEL
jgi:cytidine deaminase